MAQISRRQLIFASLCSLLLPGPQTFAAVPNTAGGPNDLQSTLTALLDRILPADQYSGSASDIGIDTQLLKELKQKPRLKTLIIRGSKWLNKQSGGSFAALAPDYQTQLISWMADKASKQKLPGLFFQQLRYQAVTLYYSSEAGSRDVGLTHPPQPRGYPEVLKNRNTHV